MRLFAKQILVYISLFAFASLPAQKKFTVVLDAGHGGSDFGAFRSYPDLGTVREKDITLAVTLRLGAMLEKNKDFKIIYTRKEDSFPSLLDRTNLANKSKADLFIAIHVNANTKSTPYGTETFVQGPDQNRTNLEVAKAENDVIYLDAQDRATFASYDPTSPESLMALKLAQSKYLENSLLFGGFVESNFEHKDKRYSRGVKQQNLHVLRMNAMPSVLIETGFVSNAAEARYLASDEGQRQIAQSIYDAVMSYKKLMDKKGGIKDTTPKVVDKPAETPLKTNLRILLMSTPMKYSDKDPALKGLSSVMVLKENGMYKYYYGVTNYNSVRDVNLKTAKDAGFRNASSVSFMPNQRLASGFYTLELLSTDKKLSANEPLLLSLKNVEREKKDGMFYYTFGRYSTLEDALKAQAELDNKGVKNTVIEKVYNK